MEPVQIIHKIVRWGVRRGSICPPPGKKNLPAGSLFFRAYQRGVGKRKNSGPVGRTKTRWYQGQFYSGYRKEA